MAGITRSQPLPLATHTLMTTKQKYKYVRIKEMLSHALGGSRGGGLFSNSETNSVSVTDGNPFQPVDDIIPSTTSPGPASAPDNSTDAGGKTPATAAKKLPVPTSS